VKGKERQKQLGIMNSNVHIPFYSRYSSSYYHIVENATSERKEREKSTQKWKTNQIEMRNEEVEKKEDKNKKESLGSQTTKERRR
jgi:hypothetical protein